MSTMSIKNPVAPLQINSAEVKVLGGSVEQDGLVKARMSSSSIIFSKRFD